MEDMSMRERFQMITSFMHMLALLVSEIGDICETIVPDEPEGGDEEEEDVSNLMERLLAKGPAAEPSASSKEEDKLVDLFGNTFEMELRSLVAALELSEGAVARRRAGSLLQRIRLQFGDRGEDRQGMPEIVGLLESAMITFLHEEGPGEDAGYLDIPFQDQDFVDYWWGLLFRQLQGNAMPTSTASKGAATRPTQTDTLDEEGLNLAADELDLMRELERQEQSMRPPEARADKEFKVYQDSQESDTHARAEEWLREREAAAYRDWQTWEMERELRAPRQRARPGQVRLHIQGGVVWPSTSWASTATSASGNWTDSIHGVDDGCRPVFAVEGVGGAGSR